VLGRGADTEDLRGLPTERFDITDAEEPRGSGPNEPLIGRELYDPSG